MKITKEEVKYIATLSRLHLSDEETEIFGSQLDAILGYVEQLNALNTKDIEPTSHVIPLTNVMRNDMLSTSLPREEALRNSPDSTERFYRVPKIIE